MIFPPKAGEFDQINIRLQRASNVKIYLTETSTYKSLKFKENIMEVETSLTVNWPNEAFILVLADETEAGADFTLSYQFNDRDPESVIENMTEEERFAYYKQKKVIDEE